MTINTVLQTMHFISGGDKSKTGREEGARTCVTRAEQGLVQRDDAPLELLDALLALERLLRQGREVVVRDVDRRLRGEVHRRSEALRKGGEAASAP